MSKDLIDELEQIKAIIEPVGVLAHDKLLVLRKYIDTRLKQLTNQSSED